MPEKESSVIADIDYDDETAELDITFTSGKKYRYFGVPADVYSDFLDAPSRGKFFNAQIKDVYDFAEVFPARRSGNR